MLSFLIIFCIVTFTVKNLSSEVFITLDEMEEPETFYDDSANDWHLNAVVGLFFSQEDTSYPFGRVDLMKSIFSNLMIGSSFCFYTSYMEVDKEWIPYSVNRQYRDFSNVLRNYSRTVLFIPEEQTTYANYQFLFSIRFNIFPVGNSTNVYLQAGTGLAFGRLKTRTINKNTNTLDQPSDFNHWDDNPTIGVFHDEELAQLTSISDGSPETTSKFSKYQVFDISVGIEISQIIITWGSNGSDKFDGGYFAAGFKF
jgi:hypothetical protein